MKTYKLFLKNQAKGREATPWLEPYREKFARAAKEAATEVKDSSLKGAAKVQLLNRLISEKLKKPDKTSG